MVKEKARNPEISGCAYEPTKPARLTTLPATCQLPTFVSFVAATFPTINNRNMANTEGISDEELSSLLTISEDDRNPIRVAPSNGLAQAPPRFPRKYLARREQMMELGEGERPSARVIRSSKPPVVHYSSSLSRKPAGENSGARQAAHSHVPTPQPPVEQDEENDEEDAHQPKINHKPVILSESIRERPVTGVNTMISTQSSQPRVKESRFKQRNRKVTPTVGGFPSLDLAPVGSLTRKGRSNHSRESHVQTVERNGSLSQSSSKPRTIPQTNNSDQAGVGMASQSMLANMSPEEIREGIDEIQSILSPASIEFLRKRGQKKKLTKAADGKQSKVISAPALSEAPQSNERLSKEEQIELEEKRTREEKEKTAQILSSIRTPEDMDRAYTEALTLGLATELPTSTLETEGQTATDLDVHMLTSLLRSTALRQRFLGVKSLCGILEQKLHDMIESRRSVSFSVDDMNSPNQTEYPPLLPVALRCLLDDAIAISHTSVGHSLLSLTLQCIQYLVMLFVHPYHLVCVNQTINNHDGEDPLVLSQTCFMSEISHIPAGSELYPPTTIEPMGNEETNKGCYRADSSAASAESDSKAFYNDPTWTLLSRMRIIPCLSDALVCISRDVSPDAVPVSETSISSICGILALLSVRSPGVAAAVAGHKVILPFIISRCLSPNTSDADSTSIFRANLALPALKLLCLLAQQSKNIAELELFESTIPDLHAILCLRNPNEQELELQTASLVLICILLRYGLATTHVQSLIHLSATHMTLQNRNDICRHYLAVFSRVCDCAKMDSYGSGDAKLDTIKEEEADNNLVLAGVWLSSAAKSSVDSLQKAMTGSSALTKQERFAHIKLAASELEFLSSYVSATDPSSQGGNNQLWVEMKSSLIPSIPQECCTEVHSTILNSPTFTIILEVALRWAFCVDWNTSNDNSDLSTQEQATACFFIASFLNFTLYLGQDRTNHDILVNQVMEVLEKFRAKRQSTICNSRCLHVSQQSWFIEAEFTVLKILCKANTAAGADDIISGFAFSLLGRLAIGNEAVASFIFCQDKLFQVHETTAGIECAHLSNATFIQNAFLRELLGPEERKAQLEHSFALRKEAFDLSSLRSSLTFGGKAEKACLLPLGGIWLWNVLSSTIDSDSVTFSDENTSHKNIADVVSHALGLLLHFETSAFSTVNAGTKLYHLANVCMYPEAILREDFVQSAVTLLYKHVTSNGDQSTLVSDFISACHHHSRISRGTKADEKSTDSIFTTQIEPETISAEQLRALEDFVGDMCDSYIEYGGQYDLFTLFMRFFLRHEMPTKIRSMILSRLHPILNLFTLDEDRAATCSSLLESVSGGLPSVDASRRDPGVVLDSFSDALNKRDKELLRADYIYLLAIAVLSRNLSSSSQRCECGVEAMKQRLSGLESKIFYDIIKVSERFLRDGKGSRESLVTCVMDVCLVDEEVLLAQAERVQAEWNWNAVTKDALWDKAMSSLKSACKVF